VAAKKHYFFSGSEVFFAINATAFPFSSGIAA
jgi:hypothetical protein